jgi:hypothetical protein
MLAESLAEFKKQNNIKDVKTCLVGDWVSKLSEQDKKDAEALLFDDPISNHKLRLFFRGIGFVVAVETIRKHRMKGCACLWTN